MAKIRHPPPPPKWLYPYRCVTFATCCVCSYVSCASWVLIVVSCIK
jgi:hypothetical protein